MAVASSTLSRPLDGELLELGRPGMSIPVALVKAARPKQWVKNALVAAAPGAAGVLSHGDALTRTLLAFVAFCLAASGTYLFNDVRDKEADRRHPVKCRRPVASGALPVSIAVAGGLCAIAGSLCLAAALGWQLVLVLAAYLSLTTAYTYRLKEIAVVDLAVVASGFILRAIAGGIALHVPLSPWFLSVASFGALFVVAGKRHGEHLTLGEEGSTVRSTLGYYPLSFLRYAWMMASCLAIATYCLWAFEQGTARHATVWYELSIIPFVMVILRYALVLELGGGGAPEEVVLSDRTLQVLGGIWLLIFAGAVYLPH
jgi:decaprenyl-phosphate phosphoribosyltransferase